MTAMLAYMGLSNSAANLLGSYTVGVAFFLVLELCITNPHALLQCLAVLAA